MILITPALLRAAIPDATAADIARYAAPLEAARAKYVGNDPAHIAMWLAQVAHESGSLKYARELATGEAYENRRDLGNTQPGDGARFRGRGLIQLTGRDNFTRCGEALELPLTERPELLEEPQHAAMSAGWFWHWSQCRLLMDEPDPLLAVTKRINGGLNGLDDRRRRYALAREALAKRQNELEMQPAGSSPPGVPQAPEAPAPDSVPVPTSDPKAPGEGLRLPPAPPSVSPAAPPAASPAASTQRPAMSPLLIPAISAVVDAIPSLVKLFGSGSKVAERNTRAVEVVADVVKSVTGAASVAAGAEQVLADPEMRAKVEQAVQDRWFDLSEAGGGGLDGARKAEAAHIASGEPLHRSPSFVIAAMLIPLVYLAMVSVSLKLPFLPDWPSDIRVAIISSVVGMVLGGIVGYYFGMMTSRNRTPTTMQ